LILRLLGLLLHRTGGKLRLTALQGSLLRASAKPGKPLADASPDAIQPLTESGLLLRGCSALAEYLLPQCRLLLGSLRTLAKCLLANTEELISRLLLRLPVGLLGL
jgi:hypothetical protein